MKEIPIIVKTTVPLMMLAGLLGAALITLLPLESLADILPTTGRLMTLLGMGGVALIGVFLPVPMAFDVIVTAMLLQAGLPVKYAMVLLVTLGIFSIYPFFMVWKAIGRWMATSLLLGLASLGVVAGVVGHLYFQWDFQRQQRVVFEVFSQSSALEGPKVLRVGGGTRAGKPENELVASLRSAALIPQPVAIAKVDGMTVERIEFQTPVAKPGTLFSRFEGSQFGLDEPYSFSILRFIEPFAEFRGIASGDVHNDAGSISS